MGRKNLLDLAREQTEQEASAPTSSSSVNKAEPSRPAGTSAVNSLRDSMRDLGLNGVQELDAHQIECDGPQDRLTVDDPELSQLAESIRAYGQVVPIMVRPIAGQLNRYAIVYGRRRLAAIRSLGSQIKVKALVRNVDDHEAIIAQGQENSQRLDPSHIEKSLFALELRRQGYENRVIQDALSIDRFACSKMIRLAEVIPIDLIKRIGSAHDVGRRPWTALADLITRFGEAGIDAAMSALDSTADDATSQQRFYIALQSLKMIAAMQDSGSSSTDVVRGPQSRLVGAEGPAPRMSLKVSAKSVSLTLDVDENPDFARWLEGAADEVAKELQDRWVRERAETR